MDQLISGPRSISISPPELNIREVIAMPFSSLVHEISQVDLQFAYATIVWAMAFCIAGLAFRKCLKNA